MRKWLDEHSLSVILISIISAFMGWAFLAANYQWQLWGMEQKDIAINGAADTYGAWVVVFLAKYFRERGSPESKEQDEDAERAGDQG